MKYLKISVLIFLGCIALAVSGVNARVIGIDRFKIPVLSSYAETNDFEKDNVGYHRVKKVDCRDDVSGDGRVIYGKIRVTVSASGVSSEHEIPKDQFYQFSEYTDPGTYRLKLGSKKKLLTTATFWGTWQLDYRPAGM